MSKSKKNIRAGMVGAMIYLPTAMHEKLAGIKRRAGIPISLTIRQALEKHLAEVK